MAETAGLVIGSIGLLPVIEVCIKTGQYLSKATNDYQQSDARINEIIIRTRICWSRLSAQLEATKNLKLRNAMTVEQITLQTQVLDILKTKIQATVDAFSKLDQTSGRTKQLQFIWLRDSFEAAVTDLESWQRRFEPTWFELIKLAPAASGIEQTLDGAALDFRQAFVDHKRKASAIKKDALDKYKITGIRYSTARIATDPSDPDSGKQHVLEVVSKDIVEEKDARTLARRLQKSRPSKFGLMECKAIQGLGEDGTTSITFVFRVPDGYDTIKSLRDLLLHSEAPETLSMRLETARQLAMAVYYIHLFDFVHKKISPETILVLEKPKGGIGGSIVCLVGFQSIRYVDRRTNTVGFGQDDSLYQHPQRRGQHGATETVHYAMWHDMYRLGVCLLEIGLWKSLVTYADDGTPTTREIHGLGQGGPEADKSRLIALCRNALRSKMGDKYGKAVDMCLTCLDEGNVDFGNPADFQDEDGVEVGAMYMKKVIDVIAGISL